MANRQLWGFKGVFGLSDQCYYNMKISMKYLERKLHIKYLVPIPLNQHMLLVPITTRDPVVTGDSTTGYVNWHAVERVHNSQFFLHRKGVGKVV